jgi:hypothetical protein
MPFIPHTPDAIAHMLEVIHPRSGKASWHYCGEL